jgi:hypothetical protein
VITTGAAEVCSVAKYYRTSPIEVYGWKRNDYEDALEYMHLDYEAQERFTEDPDK